MNSIAQKMNVALISLTVLLFTISSVTIWVAVQTRTSTDDLLNKALPNAISTIHMVDELGEMMINLVEYANGEVEERTAFKQNYQAFSEYKSQLVAANDAAIIEDLAKVEVLQQNLIIFANSRIFDTFDPLAERQANIHIQSISKPLEELLVTLLEAVLKEAKAHDAPRGDTYHVTIEYYMELVDEVTDMQSDFTRFLSGDASAKKHFLTDANEFDIYIKKLIPLEKSAVRLTQLDSAKRQFDHFFSAATELFQTFDSDAQPRAFKAVDYYSHSEYPRMKAILNKMADHSDNLLLKESEHLNHAAKIAVYVLSIVVLISAAVLTTVIVLFRRLLFTPLRKVDKAINSLRMGQRNIQFDDIEDNELGRIMKSLKTFQHELSELDILRKENARQKDVLKQDKVDLTNALENLKSAQSKLIETEKMSSLGSLVAGVSHEINTPLGISVTMASSLEDEHRKFMLKLHTGEIERKHLDDFGDVSNESFHILNRSLRQASDLITSFKQVANDQTSEQLRDFELGALMREVYSTLHHLIKSRPITYIADIDENIPMLSYPGPIGQVFTNLFNNSIIHGFEDGGSGEITLTVRRENDHVSIVYHDTGKGLDENAQKRIFEPFYTTRLGKGGSGMGMHIVYNLIVNTLQGEISVRSDNGAVFEIKLPIVIKQNEVMYECI
ncbi:sensor histidine kinase [Enterovibrio norvegicus]|uniref:sensor histidine kinase n=1 Tax=Enterovibrio norvegicus TaxID=188144 RepID=UPI000C815CD8|nr:HAMP domain-containing sensor histidine kinase [Enterovibrio norvegicus]PML81455.1 histidine kinase [Enterovibrio norvegicus]